MDYENLGILADLSGLLFGRPMAYSDAEKEELRAVIMDRTRGCSYPVVADMDFGHTSPQFVLPIGCKARIDATDESFELVEACVG